jgi:hypothetical protein
VAVGENVAVGHPTDRPLRALARLDLGDAAFLEEPLAGEKRRDEAAPVEHHLEVLLHAALVAPALLLFPLDIQDHGQAGEEVGLRAHQVLELAERDVGRVEVLGVGPQAHRGAGALFLGLLALQLLRKLAAFERDEMLFVPSVHRHFAALRQRVGDRHADAVQAAGDVVDPVARARELAAGVQHAESDLDCGLFLHRMHVDRDAAALVLDFDRVVLAQRDGDLLAEAGERLVDGVVDRLLHDVQGVDGVRVHARHAAYGLEALQRLDCRCVVNLLFGH